MRFTTDEHLLRLTALQPLNQSDREPRVYDIIPAKKIEKKAVGMRTYETLSQNGNKLISVPFISAVSVVNHLRDALWMTILDRYHFTLRDFRHPVGALLTYMMLNGGDTSIGRKLDTIEDSDVIARMPYRFPLFGVFGGTIDGAFFESLVRMSFVLPFIDDLPHWQWYVRNAEPESCLQPKNIPVSDVLAKASSAPDSPAISYFRHPAPMGEFWGRRSKNEEIEEDARQKSQQDQASASNDSKDVSDEKSSEVVAETAASDKPAKTASQGPKIELVKKRMLPMPHTFEYIPAGIPLAFTLQFADETNPVLRGVVRYAFDAWLSSRKQAVLGGHVNRGFGLVQFENFPPNETFPSADPFLEWLDQHDAHLEALLQKFAKPDLPKDLEIHPEPLYDLIDSMFAE